MEMGMIDKPVKVKEIEEGTGLILETRGFIYDIADDFSKVIIRQTQYSKTRRIGDMEEPVESGFKPENSYKEIQFPNNYHVRSIRDRGRDVVLIDMTRPKRPKPNPQMSYSWRERWTDRMTDF